MQQRRGIPSFGGYFSGTQQWLHQPRLWRPCQAQALPQTLQHMRPPKQRAIAEETLAIFVPIARRLGLTDVRVELEHLSFQYLYPEEYRRLTQEFEVLRGTLPWV